MKKGDNILINKAPIEKNKNNKENKDSMMSLKNILKSVTPRFPPNL
jgi:hypothetical protein